VRVDGFNLRTLDVKPTENFQPIDFSNWFIRPNDAIEARDHFKWMTEVAAEDLELAREVGMKPLAECVVAGYKPAVKEGQPKDEEDCAAGRRRLVYRFDTSIRVRGVAPPAIFLPLLVLSTPDLGGLR